MARAAAPTLLDRRAALRLIVAGCGSLSLAAFPASAATAPEAGAGQRLASIMPSSAAARLAARLRNVNGGMPGVERAFEPELAWLRRGAESCPTSRILAAEIRRRVRDDFAAERVLRFDGWILSRTELALCHAVSQPSHAQPSRALS